MMKQVLCIKNAHGEFYTGDLRYGKPYFVGDKEQAIQMDATEAEQEMRYMPEGCTVEVLYEYASRDVK
jgi:hypothetical protein